MLITDDGERFSCLALGAGAAAEDKATDVEATHGASEAIADARAFTATAATFYF